MYAASKIGPWPIIDMEATVNAPTAATSFGSAFNNVLPWIGTGVGGSMEKAFITYQAAAPMSVPSSNTCAFAVALSPWDGHENDLIIVDLYINYWDRVDRSSGNLSNIAKVYPFLGWSGQTSVTTNTWTTQNATTVTPLHWTIEEDEHEAYLSTQVILDGTTNAHDTSKMLLAGVAIYNNSSPSNISWLPVISISARYSRVAHNTAYRGI